MCVCACVLAWTLDIHKKTHTHTSFNVKMNLITSYFRDVIMSKQDTVWVTF